MPNNWVLGTWGIAEVWGKYMIARCLDLQGRYTSVEAEIKEI